MEDNVINLDELLPSNTVEEKKPRDITPASEQVSAEDATSEEQGSGDTIEDDSAKEENQLDESTTQEEESIEDGVETGNQAMDTIEEESTTTEESVEPQPTAEYKFKDDFIKKAVDYYDTYGNLTPFLEATSKDYDAMSDVDLLKANFDKENSDLSEKARNRLFEKELEKYNLDSYDEDDTEVGNALLKRDAGKLRKALKEEQQQFIQSIQPQGQGQQEQQPSPEELEAQQAESRKIIQGGISGVVKNNLIKVEANGEGINYQIGDTTKVVDYALDSSKFLSTFAKDGQVDWDKWTKVVAFAENPTQFISELIKHGKSLGRKMMEAELKNVTPPTNSKEVIESNENINPFDNPVDFLRGMTVRK
jgi:hypothetical protein